MEQKSSITIGVPVDAALKPERTGVEEYTFQLVSHFLAKENGGYKFILYSSFPEQKVREIFPGATRAKIVSSPYKRFWFQRVLPKLLAENKPDIFFSPSHSLPANFASLDIPGVVTIHGMEWFNVPEHYSLTERMNLREQTQRALKYASGIISVSVHTKEGIENFSRGQKAPITVIPHGVETPTRIPRRPGLPREGDPVSLAPKKTWRIIFVGRKDKRKNLQGMIRALEIVRRIAPDTAFTFSAVGPLGNDPFAKKHSDLIQSTFVSAEEKTRRYKEADIFLLPSHDEGFGMPILEAQGHGVPAVCPSFLQEVGGKGALYCEPENPQSIASAVLTLMLHPEKYNEVQKQARANAKRFSWDRCASDTLSFLEAIAHKA